jgi:hypothetical protein
LAADQHLRQAVGIPNLKDFRELLKRETAVHRSGPFCHRSDHLGKIGDPPFRPIAHEGHLMLTRHGRPGTPLPHDDAALFGSITVMHSK